MADAIDHHLKRLDHLQSVVQRLAGNSFLIKGWTVTLASAFLGFALKDLDTTASLAWLALVPVLVFWGLDGYYLAKERQLRDLYNSGTTALHAVTTALAISRTGLPDPRINPGPLVFRGWLDATTAAATSLIYIPLVICAVAVGSGALQRAAQAVGLSL